MTNMPQLPLPQGRVDLWYAYDHRLNNDLLSEYRSLLTDDELVAEQRFRLDRLRRQYVLARALQRWVLSQYVDVAPQDWRFEPGPHGKPYVAAPQVTVPAFNLSHSGGMIVCGVANLPQHTDMLGVDVEDLTRKVASLELAERYFAPAEIEFLRCLGSDFDASHFLRIWTLKEAYIKAIGKGLSKPLDEFAFSFDQDHPPTIEFADGSDARRWRFGEIHFRRQYHLSVAVELDESDEFEVVAKQVVPLRTDSECELHCCRDNHWFAQVEADGDDAD